MYSIFITVSGCCPSSTVVLTLFKISNPLQNYPQLQQNARIGSNKFVNNLIEFLGNQCTVARHWLRLLLPFLCGVLAVQLSRGMAHNLNGRGESVTPATALKEIGGESSGFLKVNRWMRRVKKTNISVLDICSPMHIRWPERVHNNVNLFCQAKSQ